MPDFRTYYKSFNWKQKNKINKVLCEQLDRSYPTIWRKMENNTFTKLEKEKIAEILHKPIDELFPIPALENFLANS